MVVDKKNICIGKITVPHGIKGLVKLKSYTEDPDTIFTFKEIFDKKLKKYKIKRKSQQKDNFIIEIEGITNRNQSEAIKGLELYIDKTELPITNEDEFYFNDLVGLDVVQDNNKIGHIKSVQNFGGGDLFEIKFDNKNTTELILFNKKNFPEINIKEGFVIVDEDL